jgi:5-methyltetrahydropteroyltriglutamate--homocysteine methyltransferase
MRLTKLNIHFRVQTRKTSPRIHNSAVQEKMKTLTPDMFKRKDPFPERQLKQRQKLGLPSFPTTTVGSFPQTKEVRAVRAKLKKGELSQDQYDDFIKKETEKCVRFQEETGIDVLVHGEFERNDMVEYFGENLEGIYIFKFACQCHLIELNK